MDWGVGTGLSFQVEMWRSPHSTPHCQRYLQPRWTFLDQGLGFHQTVSVAQPPSLSPYTPASPQPKLPLWVFIYIHFF